MVEEVESTPPTWALYSLQPDSDRRSSLSSPGGRSLRRSASALTVNELPAPAALPPSPGRALQRSGTVKLPPKKKTSGDRAIAPSSRKAIPVSKSLDVLPADYRLHPELGTAAIYKQPGGMRRAHILQSLGEAPSSPKGGRRGSVRAAYAMTPLVAHIRSTEDHGFVSEALHELQDGTVVRYESRHYRRGRAPEIVRLPSGMAPEKPEALQFCGWKPSSISWWVSISFLIGGVLFTIGSLAWMIPSVGGATAPAWEAAYTVSYPFFVGSVFFLLGCYLQLVEVLNANLQEEVHHLNPSGSLHRRSAQRSSRASTRKSARMSASSARSSNDSDASSPRPFYVLEEEDHTVVQFELDEDGCCGCGKLRWWGWQPHSLLYWAALAQFIGAIAFEVSCVAGLPGLIEGHMQDLVFVYWPSIIGSCGFSFASFVYVAEVTHSLCVLVPERLTFGYFVAISNLVGSLLFLLASIFYLVAREPWEVVEPWEYYVSEWGTRFTFAVGSACFVLGAMLSFPEILN